MDYRFFFVGVNGHIVRRAERWCADDSEALMHGRVLAECSGIEIWQAARFVARIERHDRHPTLLACA
ncbi:MAG TPA: hypothetical protein VHU87_07725 [Rhizomicrobium sp.]|jgi:hypothetical protein|nr:hypothetical protein [Rhizomicrobium sp.]